MKYRYLCVVSYDGSNYGGFQRQNNTVSIQGEIEKALRNMTRTDITIHSAGRTDKGVHALNQVFHFDFGYLMNLDVFVIGFNKRLNKDIIIKSVEIVDLEFNARYSAKSRIYEYRIAKEPSDIFSQRYETYVENFDINIAKECVKMFIGQKDFTGFSKLLIGKDPIRTINSLDIVETNEQYIFVFNGVSFLRYMIRSIMGTIIDVSTNKMDISTIEEIFESNNRKLAGVTAPANGLFFKEVIY